MWEGLCVLIAWSAFARCSFDTDGASSP